jgi:signal transduction histidine kinase
LCPEKLKSGLEKQREHLARITRIVDNILDESRIDRGHMTMATQSFDLSDMVLHIVDEFKIAAEDVGVSVSVDTENSIVGKWDRFKIEQVLLNLLSNALRYGDKKPIRIRSYKEANFAFFSVQDEGVGIRIEDQARIFERFERVAEESGVKGFGLGLFISNSIVKAHHGEISVKSEPGKGSTFTVALPL